MTQPPIPRGPDGFFHPGCEADVIALVNYAREQRLQVRARGATHSIALSIYSDPVGGLPVNKTLEQAPPRGANIDIAFDRMMALDWIDEDNGVVEAEPGIHLGRDPQDPFGASTLENSFLHQIFQRGWAIDITGGIIHQTLAGFTGTGSAGGSVIYGLDNVIAFRVVDGLGQASWIEQGDPGFGAMLTACGLMGIVTRLRLQLVPMYNIAGTETTYSTGADCPIDLFGPGSPSRPSLQQYLAQTPYSRLTWWPQKGCERVQVWQAERAPFSNQDLVPYQQFTPDLLGQAKQFMASIFFVLLGNTNLFTILKLLMTKVVRLYSNLVFMWRGHGVGTGPARAAGPAVLAAAVGGIAGVVLGIVPGTMQRLFSTVLPLFNPLTKPGGQTTFSDWYWRSLPMDNTADDVFLGTEFVEIWLPIQYTQQVMGLLQGMFDAKGNAATGWFALEVYAAKPSAGWINPSYSDGTDLYKDGVSRFDVYWYRDNAGTPDSAHGFFRQYWEMLRAAGIPFRFHWGKFTPRYDFADWAGFYRQQLPRFQDFLDLRQQRDPDGVFLTKYWRETLLS